MRPMYKCFGVFLAVSLALFFGLFFGLNYPEIVRHGWPLTRCTVLSSEIATRYCCETSCSTGSCQSAPGGSPQCNSVISSIDSGYSPSACASNSSSCPTQSGSVCDGGYYCCQTCCQTCQSCTSSCSGNPTTCTQSCTSYTCNCYCCSSTSDLYCTLSCPICYKVDLQLLYLSQDGVSHNVSYVQDFSQDVNNADSFLNRHLANSTSFCNYNPKDESQVLFDVSFTTWKWVITAIFGMLPLFVALGLFAYFLLVLPCSNLVRAGYNDSVYAARARAWGRGMLSQKRSEAVANGGSDAPPPAYELKEGNA
ncbi:hypothetical protein B0H11DRAFT_1893838 [Mycena galericulata]|nr:hypothetical protein B0H11DRAFT_1893838 [Mycena galericulata]